MQVLNKSILDLKPYKKNPRNNDGAVEIVAKSIQSFGFKVPLVIDKNNVIVAGHTRYKAAMQLDLKEVPCIIADDLNEEEIKAFRIADNRVAEAAQWDNALLLDELDELKNMDFDIEITGFNLMDIEKMRLGAYDFNDGNDYDYDNDDGNDVGIIQYNIIFNDEAEQQKWQSFLKFLKNKYQDLDTISERIIAATSEIMHE